MLQNADKNDIILHKIRQDKTAAHGVKCINPIRVQTILYIYTIY